MVQPIPTGFEGRIVPYLMVDGAAGAIDFYRRAFGAFHAHVRDVSPQEMQEALERMAGG